MTSLTSGKPVGSMVRERKKEIVDMGITLGTGSITAKAMTRPQSQFLFPTIGYPPVWINWYTSTGPNTDSHWRRAETALNIKLTSMIYTGTKLDFVLVHKMNTACIRWFSAIRSSSTDLDNFAGPMLFFALGVLSPIPFDIIKPPTCYSVYYTV